MFYEPDNEIGHYLSILGDGLDAKHDPQDYAQVAVLWHLIKALQRIEAAVADIAARLDELDG